MKIRMDGLLDGQSAVAERFEKAKLHVRTLVRMLGQVAKPLIEIAKNVTLISVYIFVHHHKYNEWTNDQSNKR